MYVRCRSYSLVIKYIVGKNDIKDAEVYGQYRIGYRGCDLRRMLCPVFLKGRQRTSGVAGVDERR